APGLEAALAQTQIGLVEVLACEDLRRVDHLAHAIQAPLPAVEGAGESRRTIASVLHELYAAVPASILISLDRRRVDARDDDRMLENVVDDEIAGLRNLLQAARHLPHPRPQTLAFQRIEIRIVVAARGHSVRPGDEMGDVFAASPSGIRHRWSPVE